MKKNTGLKEALLKTTLKKTDPVELPMDEKFFDQLHDKIMASVEKIEIHEPKRWEKTWIFLESKAKPHRASAKKVVKFGFVGMAFTLAVGLASFSAKLYNQVSVSQESMNQKLIIQEAKQNPTEWSDLVISYQSENDFYADVLSQKNDLGTIVEIDRVLLQSL